MTAKSKATLTYSILAVFCNAICISFIGLCAMDIGWEYSFWRLFVSGFFIAIANEIAIMFTYIFVEGNADHETEEKWKKRCKIIRYACHVYLLLVIIGLNIRWCNEGEQIDTILFLDIFIFSIAAGVILGVELSIAEGARPHCSSYTGSSTRSSHRTYSSWDSDDEDDSWLSSSWESGRTNDPWSHPWSTKSIAEENRERRMRQSDIEDMSYEKDVDLYDHYDWEDIEDARDNDVF